MYCFEKPSEVQTWKVYLAPIGMIMSILCLTFLILLHFSTKKLLNLQGYCFLCYSISLLLAYVGFFVSFKYSKQMNNMHCVFNALFSQFTLHAAFFWLSVMCFDIWRVIRSSVKLIPLAVILEKDKQKFLLYASFAFGCPLVIVLVTLLMQSLPNKATKGLIVPGFGEESCWFAGELAQFLYFYLAIATLIALSLCILGHVTYMLRQAEPGMGCCLRKSKGPRAFNRKHLSLFRQRLMIFVLMAICWSAEVLSLWIPPKDAWVVTDLLNTLQGVFVFIIFLLSKQKRQLVKERLHKIFKKTKKTLQKTNSNTESTAGSTEQSQREMANALWDTSVLRRPERSLARKESSEKRAQQERSPARKESSEKGVQQEGSLARKESSEKRVQRERSPTRRETSQKGVQREKSPAKKESNEKGVQREKSPAKKESSEKGVQREKSPARKESREKGEFLSRKERSKEKGVQREKSPARKESSKKRVQRERSPARRETSQKGVQREKSPAKKESSEKGVQREKSPARKESSEKGVQQEGSLARKESSEKGVQREGRLARKESSKKRVQRERSPATKESSEKRVQRERSPARKESSEKRVQREKSPARKESSEKRVQRERVQR
ncbi:probable G-protein coupled receptor Mth-like 1 [Macrobrachium nipponense]|uniref:probable G-protein coupled receptor Mth-like 1 n=1 Tax=Macrobrachium nipponense TaxID=159736 RepID=UPI0030C83057